MLFGVPDEITNMTRSLEVVERQIFIYWTRIVGHQKCSGWFRRKPECRRGYRNPPGKYWALVGLRGERGSPQGVAAQGVLD